MSQDPVRKSFLKMGANQAKHHLFLCLGPECCALTEGTKVWEFLKMQVSSRHLSILRSKVGCLRVCSGGPILLVYPEGIWYGGVTVERMEQILTEHIVGGVPVQEWILHQHPLEKTADLSRSGDSLS